MQRKPRSRGALNRLEERIGSAVERPFSRAFRSPVQPAEIERACIREIEKSRKLGVDTIYVANVFYVVMSPRDEEEFGDLLATLEKDLSTRLFAYASNNRYLMNTRPIISFLVDDDFKLGDLFVYAEHMSEQKVAEEFGIDFHPKASPTPGPAPVPTPSSSPFAEPDSPQVPATSIAVTVAGRVPLTLDPARRYTIGRHEDSDIWVPDPQASRAHAELYVQGGGWVIHDLRSTNGTLVNGVPVTVQPLVNGDSIQIGEVAITVSANSGLGGEPW